MKMHFLVSIFLISFFQSSLLSPMDGPYSEDYDGMSYRRIRSSLNSYYIQGPDGRQMEVNDNEGVFLYHKGHLLYKKFSITELKWHDGVPPEKNRLQVKWFYTSYRVNATVSFSEDNSTMYLTIDQLDWGMSEGQDVSFYDNDKFLGWGIITSMNQMP